MVWPKGELSQLSVGNTACNVHLRSARIMNSFREEREPKSSTYFLVPASDLICDLSVTKWQFTELGGNGATLKISHWVKQRLGFAAAVNGIIRICEGLLVCSFLKWGSCWDKSIQIKILTFPGNTVGKKEFFRNLLKSITCNMVEADNHPPILAFLFQQN